MRNKFVGGDEEAAAILRQLEGAVSGTLTPLGNDSFFSICDRDEKGRCLPSGHSSAGGGGNSLDSRTNATVKGEVESAPRSQSGDKVPRASHTAPPPKELLAKLGASSTHDKWLAGSHAKALDDTGSRDHFMEEQLRELGYAGKPQVATAAQLQELTEAGAPVLYRGYPSANFANDYRSGDLFGGRGIYGNGTYAAYDSPASATNFPRQNHKDNAALTVADNYAGSGGGVVQRAVLTQDARVGNYQDILKEQKTFLEEIDREYRKLGMGLFNKKAKAEKARLIRLRQLYSGQYNLGRYAALAGYDAVDVPHEKYLVLLNRSKVVVEDVNHAQKN